MLETLFGTNKVKDTEKLKELNELHGKVYALEYKVAKLENKYDDLNSRRRVLVEDVEVLEKAAKKNTFSLNELFKVPLQIVTVGFGIGLAIFFVMGGTTAVIFAISHLH